MKLLSDTHLLLWAAGQPDRLSPAARALLYDDENRPMFSAASLWEIAIKNGLGDARTFAWNRASCGAGCWTTAGRNCP